MIYPHEVTVKKGPPIEYVALEEKVDRFLRNSTWIEGESNKLSIDCPLKWSDSYSTPRVRWVVKTYVAAGWNVKSHGYTSVVFQAPTKHQLTPPAERGRWWRLKECFRRLSCAAA